MKICQVLLVMAALLLVLSACVSEVDRESLTPVPTLTPTLPPVPTATSTPVATPTPTAMPTPPAPTLTPTSTLRPTPPAPISTPRPTAAPLPERNVDQLPHVFVGSVTIGGAIAPDGTAVSVWIAEFDGPVGTGVTSGGGYYVLAHQHGTDSFNGKMLTFKVNGQDTGETGSWDRGDATILDLSLG